MLFEQPKTSKGNDKIVNYLLSLQGIQINKNTFSKCSRLTEIKLPSSVEISLPDSLKSIGDSSLGGCSSLKEIKIPPNLDRAFQNCASLQLLNAQMFFNL